MMSNHVQSSYKTVFALDLGTATGWAVQDRTGIILSGTINFKTQRFEGGGMTYFRFRQWLTELKNSCGSIDLIYFEKVRKHLGIDAAHKYRGFLTHLTA